MKKVAFLTFPLSKVGGIITNVTNLQKGFESLGYEVDKYFISLNTRKLPEKNDFDFENIVGFEREEWYQDYLNKINSYDLVIWVVCAPHILKNYKKETWKKCFKIDPPQLAYIHDNYYEKYYSWFKEIPLKYNVKMICPYQYMHDSIQSLKAMKRIIDNPVEIKEAGVYKENKCNLLVDHNNWKGIKHKEIVVKNAAQLDCDIIMYGDDTLEKKQAKLLPGFERIIDKGWSDHSVIYEDLKVAKVVTDLCKRGNVKTIYDYTITEAIAFGAIPVLQTPICEHHKDIFVEYATPFNIVRVVNNIMQNFDVYDEKIENNLKFLERINPQYIAQLIIDYANAPYEEEKFHEFW